MPCPTPALPGLPRRPESDSGCPRSRPSLSKEAACRHLHTAPTSRSDFIFFARSAEEAERLRAEVLSDMRTLGWHINTSKSVGAAAAGPAVAVPRLADLLVRALGYGTYQRAGFLSHLTVATDPQPARDLPGVRAVLRPAATPASAGSQDPQVPVSCRTCLRFSAQHTVWQQATDPPADCLEAPAHRSCGQGGPDCPAPPPPY